MASINSLTGDIQILFDVSGAFGGPGGVGTAGVPYQGATADVNLGSYSLTAGTLSALSITSQSSISAWTTLSAGATRFNSVKADGSISGITISGGASNFNSISSVTISALSERLGTLWFNDGTSMSTASVGSSSGGVPYIGATADVNLGNYSLTAYHISAVSLSVGTGTVYIDNSGLTSSTLSSTNVKIGSLLVNAGNLVVSNGSISARGDLITADGSSLADDGTDLFITTPTGNWISISRTQFGPIVLGNGGISANHGYISNSLIANGSIISNSAVGGYSVSAGVGGFYTNNSTLIDDGVNLSLSTPTGTYIQLSRTGPGASSSYGNIVLCGAVSSISLSTGNTKVSSITFGDGTSMQSAAGGIAGGANLPISGSGTAGVFAQALGSTLQFKTLVAGTNITLTESASAITIVSGTAITGSGGGVPYTGATGNVDLGVYQLTARSLSSSNLLIEKRNLGAYGPEIWLPTRSRTFDAVYIQDSNAFENTAPHALLNVHRHGPSGYQGSDNLNAGIFIMYTDATRLPQPQLTSTLRLWQDIGSTLSGTWTNNPGTGAIYYPVSAIGLENYVRNYTASAVTSIVVYLAGFEHLSAYGSSATTFSQDVKMFLALPANIQAGGASSIISAYFSDQPSGTGYNAAIALETEGKIDWNKDVQLKRISSGVLNVAGSLTADNTISATNIAATNTINAGSITSQNTIHAFGDIIAFGGSYLKGLGAAPRLELDDNANYFGGADDVQITLRLDGFQIGRIVANRNPMFPNAPVSSVNIEYNPNKGGFYIGQNSGNADLLIDFYGITANNSLSATKTLSAGNTRLNSLVTNSSISAGSSLSAGASRFDSISAQTISAFGSRFTQIWFADGTGPMITAPTGGGVPVGFVQYTATANLSMGQYSITANGISAIGITAGTITTNGLTAIGSISSQTLSAFSSRFNRVWFSDGSSMITAPNSGGVPYSGASANVDLGTFSLSAGSISANGLTTKTGTTYLGALGGRVQIGISASTSVPYGLLQINTISLDDSASPTGGIVFTNNNNNTGPWGHAAIWSEGKNGFNGELVFGTDNDGVNSINIIERLRIGSNGSITAKGSISATNLSANSISAVGSGLGVSGGYGQFVSLSAFTGLSANVLGANVININNGGWFGGSISSGGSISANAVVSAQGYFANSSASSIFQGGGKVGFGGTPYAQVHYVTSNDTTPSQVTDWDNRHVAWTNAVGSRSPGMGISTTNGSPGTVNMSFLQPSVAWQNWIVGAHSFLLQSDGTFAGIYQDATGKVGIGQTANISANFTISGATVATAGLGSISSLSMSSGAGKFNSLTSVAISAGTLFLPVTTLTQSLTYNISLPYTFAATSLTANLPSPATVGIAYNIKSVSAGSVTVSATQGSLIDGQPTQIITNQYVSILVVSNGTNWFII